MMYRYRPLESGEQTPFFDTIDHALGVVFPRPNSFEPFVEIIGPENLRALECDSRLIGGLGIYRTGQWFGGRVVPCAGVSVVGVAPEYRGQGAARFGLVSMLNELADEKTPIACLYPSTQRLYRSVDFEQAGSWCRHKLSLQSIAVRDLELPVHRIDPPTAEAFEQIAEVRGRRTNGNLARTPGMWNRILKFRAEPNYNVLIGDAQEPQGFVCYRNQDQDGETDLWVSDMAATTAPAARRLWTFLADHRSICSSVRWAGPPTEPLLAVTEECKRVPVEQIRWMIRIVDLARALELRGYPADLEAELHLDVVDDLLPQNTGRFVLRVTSGQGQVTRGGNGDLRCKIRGLAPLYSSFLSPDSLRSVGWLEGSDRGVRAASLIFAGPEPWMPEIF